MKKLVLLALCLFTAWAASAQLDTNSPVIYDTYRYFPDSQSAVEYLRYQDGLNGFNIYLVKDSGCTILELNTREIDYDEGYILETIRPPFPIGEIRPENLKPSVESINPNLHVWYPESIRVFSTDQGEILHPYHFQRDSSVIMLVFFNEWTQQLNRTPYYDLTGKKIRMADIPTVSDKFWAPPHYKQYSTLIGEEVVQIDSLKFNCYKFQISKSGYTRQDVFFEEVSEVFIDQQTFLPIKMIDYGDKVKIVTQVSPR